MADYELYIDGEKVTPPRGWFVLFSRDPYWSYIHLARRKRSEVVIGGFEGYERTDIPLAPGQVLELRIQGRRVVHFVEMDGIAVDPLLKWRRPATHPPKIENILDGLKGEYEQTGKGIYVNYQHEPRSTS